MRFSASTTLTTPVNSNNNPVKDWKPVVGTLQAELCTAITWAKRTASALRILSTVAAPSLQGMSWQPVMITTSNFRPGRRQGDARGVNGTRYITTRLCRGSCCASEWPCLQRIHATREKGPKLDLPSESCIKNPHDRPAGAFTERPRPVFRFVRLPVCPNHRVEVHRPIVRPVLHDTGAPML